MTIGKIAREGMSPVLIGTCNRLQHFRNLIESLQSCYWADSTELYVAIDAPYADAVREVNQQIVDYAQTITGFAKVHLIIRPRNVGPVENFHTAMDQIFATHDTLILLEDDNVVARNFLVYMNKALAAFQDDPKCFAVCGYTFTTEAIEEPSMTDIYTAPYQSAWGVGYWRGKYINYTSDTSRRPDIFLLNPLRMWKLYQHNPPLFSAYVGSVLAGKYFEDVEISLWCLKHGWYCVYPRRTKVINNGFDGSGIHCGTTNFEMQKNFVSQDTLNIFFPIVTEVNSYYRRKNRIFFKTNIPIRPYKILYAHLMYLIMTLFGVQNTIRLRSLVKGESTEDLKDGKAGK